MKQIRSLLKSLLAAFNAMLWLTGVLGLFYLVGIVWAFLPDIMSMSFPEVAFAALMILCLFAFNGGICLTMIVISTQKIKESANRQHDHVSGQSQRRRQTHIRRRRP